MIDKSWHSHIHQKWNADANYLLSNIFYLISIIYVYIFSS